MIFPFFNLALLPFYPALGLYTLHRRFIQKKSAASFAGQWGKTTPEMREFGKSNGPKIWLHAVSVGETMAVKPIALAIKAQNPQARIALSSTTDTGHEIAQSLLRDGVVDCIFYFPLDLPFVVSRVLNVLQPDKLCFIETELWPNLLHLARKRGIQTFLLNGRVSDNLLSTAPKIRPIWKWMSSNITKFLMRNDTDAGRLKSLGVDDKKIIVTGDVKLEAPLALGEFLRKEWRGNLGIADEKLLICGSTHTGEEQIFVDFAKANPTVKVAIAPRHVNRAEEVTEIIVASGLNVCSRTGGKKWRDGEIFLLDTVGELSNFYAAGDLAFVGGSLIKRGGHNVLEPVLRGVPVLFGPYTMNFRNAVELVKENGLGEEITADSLSAIDKWLEPQPNYSKKVETALASHRGAAKRMAEIILS